MNAQRTARADTLPLSEGASDQKYMIVAMADEVRLRNRLSSMGLIEGSELEICQNRKKQPILIYARDTLIAIGRGEAEKIAVRGVTR